MLKFSTWVFNTLLENSAIPDKIKAHFLSFPYFQQANMLKTTLKSALSIFPEIFCPCLNVEKSRV